MFIVDSQVHIWAPETPQRPWIEGGAGRVTLMGHRAEPLGYEELRGLMDEAGVNRAIIVPPSFEGDRIDLGLEAVHHYPDRFAVMARIPLDQPEQAKQLIASWKDEPGIKGVRLTFHRPQDRPWITDGTADWYWPFAERLRIPTMVHAPYSKSEVGQIAAKHPGLRLIIDHMGILGHTTDDGVAPWIADTAQLAKHPNVYVKVSAIPGYSTEPYPFPKLNKYVQQVVEAFGARRCFWGTDLSRMLGKCKLTYGQVVEHFTKHMGFLSQDDMEWIMGRAICECLKWPIPASTTAASSGTSLRGV
jgi:predicted TIM-barrel fold metal-dependent hydrolase